MLNSARFNPIDRTVRPCMDTVIYPNTCSIRHLVFDLTRLLSFCSFVSAFPRKPFSQTLFSICSGSSLPIYALSQSENRPLIAYLPAGADPVLGVSAEQKEQKANQRRSIIRLEACPIGLVRVVRVIRDGDRLAFSAVLRVFGIEIMRILFSIYLVLDHGVSFAFAFDLQNSCLGGWKPCNPRFVKEATPNSKNKEKQAKQKYNFFRFLFFRRAIRMHCHCSVFLQMLFGNL